MNTRRFKTIVMAAILLAAIISCQPREDESDKRKSIDEFLGLFLAAMDEPPLQNFAGEAYRFLFVPTFSQPIAIRVSCVEGQCKVTSKQLSGKGGYEIGVLAHQSSRGISQEEWQHLQVAVAKTNFWAMSRKKFSLKGVGPMDSSLWALEGKKMDQHGFWVGWSLGFEEKDTGPRSLCLEILELSGLEYELAVSD